MRAFLTLSLASGLALTSACTESNFTPKVPPKFDLAFSNCQRITGAQGKYVAGPVGTNGVPVVKAGPGGNLRGEVLMNECIADNLGTGLAKEAVAAPKPAPGKLPLPTDYPLLPGDAELWATLTLEQQERALLFLEDGGTIRGSLSFE